MLQENINISLGNTLNTTGQNFLNLIVKFFLTPVCHWTNFRQQLHTGVLFRGYDQDMYNYTDLPGLQWG